MWKILCMNQLKIISYNVWFEQFMEVERTISLLININKHKPDVVCFQEVRPKIFNILIEKLKEYKYFFPLKISKNYGCVIFSKLPIIDSVVYPYENTKMDRNLTCVTIAYPCKIKINDDITIQQRDVLIATSHYESEFKYKHLNKNKINQFRQTEKIMNDLFNSKCQNIIICADFNILEHEEPYFIKDDFKDAWIEKGKLDECYTYDSFHNIYLMMKGYSYLSRVDRILYKLTTCKLIDFKIINGIPEQPEPSDHFGVVGKFEVK